eukprot:TRINITY_DN1467_c0_g1_i1.p1 TRINITY_DN1467_c0_g1~~TRINITY_DN1467_c0_g1_i1.p1  ORF type:complete len:491 (+),score=129.37 TRINITY_DN1467_c0_g1_i1:40-1512(+)
MMASHRSKSSRSGSPGSLIYQSHIPAGTAVQVYDEKEDQWYEGAHVVDFDGAVYSILWVNGETTAAEPQFVKTAARKRVEWTRVKHEKPFAVSAKKATYREYYSGETDPTVDVLVEPPEPPAEEMPIEVAEPEVKWVAPSRKNSEIPEIVSEEPVVQPKKLHGWQRRVNRFEARQKKKVSERPAFDTRSSGKQKGWSTWVSQMPPLPEKEHKDPYARYAGRFAPEEEQDALETYEPSPMAIAASEQQKKNKKKKKPASPKKEVAVTESASATPAAAPVEKSPPNQPSDSPARVEQKSEGASPPAAPVEEEEAVMSEPDVGSEGDEDLTIPTGEDEPHVERRAKLFTTLSAEEGDNIPLTTLKTDVTNAMHISDVYDQGVSSAYSVAKTISQLNDTPGLTRPEFRVFLISFSRYIALYDLFGESLKGEEGTLKIIEPEEFEKAVPLLSQWGAEMADIEEAFTSDSSDSQITFDDFFAWGIKQGIQSSHLIE